MHEIDSKSIVENIQTKSYKKILKGPTIKNCWFAVLLPTRQNWPYTKNFMAILRKICCLFSKI